MLIFVSRIGLKDVREIVWKVVSADEQEVADQTIALISHKGKVLRICSAQVTPSLSPANLVYVRVRARMIYPAGITLILLYLT